MRSEVTRDRPAEAIEAAKMRELWASVVMVTMNDAIRDEQKFKTGAEFIRRWANGKDGKTVLSLAGIEPCERTTNHLVEFVMRGIPTTQMASREHEGLESDE